MNRATRAARSFTLGECSKSMSMHSGILLLCHIPRDVGDSLRATPLFQRVLTGGVALQCARKHAVQDRSNPEHVKDEIELPMRDLRAACPVALPSDVRGPRVVPAHTQ